MSDKLKLAVVGCGEIAPTTVKATNTQSRRAEYIVAVDIVPENAEKLARTFSLQVADWNEMLKRDDVDAVYISTPHFEHGHQAIESLQAGKHVMLEKPFALSLEECHRIVEIAREKDLFVGASFPMRYGGVPKKAKELYDSGAIGDFIAANWCMCQDRGEKYYRYGVTGKGPEAHWREYKEKSGGGNIIMNGIHYTDMINWITGEKAVSACCVGGTYAQKITIEDLAYALIKYSNGAAVSFNGGFSAKGALPYHFRILGTRGHIVLDGYWDNLVKLYSETPPQGIEANQWVDIPVTQPVHERAVLLDAFAEKILDQKEGAPTSEDGINAVAPLLAIYKSLETGQMEEVVY
ncbi:MAG: Gfo/Idh/MocA family oxidoreductase [bacterium]